MQFYKRHIFASDQRKNQKGESKSSKQKPPGKPYPDFTDLKLLNPKQQATKGNKSHPKQALESNKTLTKV